MNDGNKGSMGRGIIKGNLKKSSLTLKSGKGRGGLNKTKKSKKGIDS